jgi:S1-C subfamily serine protease
MLDREPTFSQGVDGLSPESRIKDAGQKLCGLGIAFKPDKRGNLFVKRLVPGGPADTSKLIEVSGSAGRSHSVSGGRTATARPALLGWERVRVTLIISRAWPRKSSELCLRVRLHVCPHPHLPQAGDVLHAVDGKNVIGMNKLEVASLLMGPAGSKVRLRFLRQEASGNGSCYKGVRAHR